MPLLAYGDYRPDVSDYEGQATRNILNVVPRGDGYYLLLCLRLIY